MGLKIRVYFNNYTLARLSIRLAQFFVKIARRICVQGFTDDHLAMAQEQLDSALRNETDKLFTSVNDHPDLNDE